jgi:pimeloyl-ACP methyl ester carboxylesterase
VQLNEILSEVAALKKQRYADYITVNGMRIRYAVIGNGPPVLMLHGFGGFLETWAYNIPCLSQHFRVYAIDLPGHGLSDKPQVDYTTTFATDYAESLVQAFGIEKPILIGHSMGGAIAISVALGLPGMIDKLVLVDSAGLSAQIPLAYRLSSPPLAGEILTRVVTRANLKRSLQSLFYNPKALTEEMLDMAFTNAQRPGTKKALLRILRHSINLAGPRPEAVLIDRLPELKMPVLFVHGAQDSLFPLKYVEQAFSLPPNARVEIINHCGHCPQIEKPVEFNESVMDFLTTG